MVRRTEVLQGLRMMKFLSLLDRVEAAELSKLEAAEILGMSERTFRRWCERYREEGEAGLFDRRLGKASAKRVPDADAEEIERLYRERYQGFTAKHFHEHLVADHGFRWGYTWTKTFLHGRGLLRPAPRRGAHRRRRPRKPLPGMMLHQDASRHVWVPGQPACDLVVTLDDATGEIYSAILVAEEGTASTFRALLAVFARHGLPCSLYTDRGSHYFVTTKAGEKPDPKARTQVGRALAQLGVEHIAAFSPQARGRSERLPDAAGPPAEGTRARRHRRHRGRQRLPRTRPPTLERPLRRPGRAAGDGLRSGRRSPTAQARGPIAGRREVR